MFLLGYYGKKKIGIMVYLIHKKDWGNKSGNKKFKI